MAKKLINELSGKVLSLLRGRARLDESTFNAAKGHRSFDSMAAILGWLLTLAKGEFKDFALDGRKTLEIGTGKFMTNALGLYICGCSEVITVDKYKQLLPAAVKLAMQRPLLARRFLSTSTSHDEFMTRLNDISRTGYDMEQLEALGIKYMAPLDLIGAGEFHNSFDFVFSYTVLEHVPFPEIKDLLRESVSALKPGGFCVHFVDLEDHINSQDDPFEFLSADFDWKEEESFTRGNRLRFSTWKNMLNEHVDIEWRFPYVAVRHDAALPSSIVNQIEYRDEEDLRTTAFVVTGRRLG